MCCTLLAAHDRGTVYFTQLDEDVRVLLQRFDDLGADESEQKGNVLLLRRSEAD